jgi:anthranilate synthase component 1
VNSKLYPATFAEFEQQTRRGNVVPVIRTITDHAFNAVDAFIKLSSESRHAFLFESVEGEERVAQYSFVGADPYKIVRGQGNQTIVESGEGHQTLSLCASDYLKDHFRRQHLAPMREQVPLAGGVVGYLGYNAASWFEPAVNFSRAAMPEWDDALFMFCRTLIVFDHRSADVKLVSVVFKDDGNEDRVSLQHIYDGAVNETQRLSDLLDNSTTSVYRSAMDTVNQDTRLNSNWTRHDFQNAVDQVKQHILAGDCYQVVLSQRFHRDVSANPVAIYQALRRSNPSPYMYFLKLDSDSIIGASPEMLVRCRGEDIDYRPIAGTRPRGATEAEDNYLAEDMRRDEKEIAEHMMLVDLGRNDVGRVATFGSVCVEELMSVERYSKVQHLVSSLRARLRPDCDRFDALAACFPAGTVTGAPKVKAMQIIRALEPEPRNVYAGAILYADYADNLDSCIAIRTIELRNGRASVQAGAGIVADSIPEREYVETVDKAQALWRAIEMAETELTHTVAENER